MFSASVTESEEWYPINRSCTFTDQTYWQVWEDDEGTTCGAARDGEDDFIVGSSFRITDPATATHGAYAIPCTRGTPCVILPEDKNIEGVMDYSTQKDSLPFRGAIDSLQIYRQVLDPAEIRTIFLGTYTALNLGLDEAPGSTSFEDASAGNHDGVCSALGATATCPTAGLGGRDARAVLFNADEQDHLTVGDFGDLQTATVSAWVYRTASTNAHATIVSAQESADCGFVLALNDDGASQLPMFSAWIADGGSSALQKVEGGEAVPLDTWVHLAGVYDGQALHLYRNGTEVASAAAAGAA